MRNKIYNHRWRQKKTFGKPKCMPKRNHTLAQSILRKPIYNQERAVVEQMTACSLIGSPESVEFQLKQLRERVHFDEIMAVSYIFDEQKTSPILYDVKIDCG